jgi:hypothetical protein
MLKTPNTLNFLGTPSPVFPQYDLRLTDDKIWNLVCPIFLSGPTTRLSSGNCGIPPRNGYDVELKIHKHILKSGFLACLLPVSVLGPLVVIIK